MTTQNHKDIFSYLKILFSKDLFGFSFFFLAGFLTLISLGTWQVQRLSEKTDLIASMTEKLEQAPQPIEDLILVHLQNDHDVEFLKTHAIGTLDTNVHFKMMSQTYDGNMGYHYIAVMTLETGGKILVDLGWLPHNKNPTDLKLPTSKIRIQGTLRYASETNNFTPENNYTSGELYSVNPKEVQNKADIKDLYPLYITNIVQGPVAEGFPIKKPFQLSIRNQHLNYALTWYSLAIVWLLCFVFFVRDRLRKINLKA